ncbi:MAG: hypothetical protein GEU92_16455 [Alphaproteobacteria bacterium]|nr:hypothetical protein [Alphaproteobacteria bacterium]
MGIFRGSRRRAPPLLAVSLCAVLGGCAQLSATGQDTVDVEVSYIAEIAPGLRHFVAWPVAREQCAARGLEPELTGLDGAIVHYRCVAPE